MYKILQTRERLGPPPEKRWQEYAREAQDLRDAIDQHAVVAITDEAGTITFANDLFCEISGYSRDELIGQDHRIVNSGHHSKEFMADLWATITGGVVWHGELKNKAKDGTYYWVDTTIVPFLDEDGKPRQYMSIRTLITKRKDAEQQLRVERDRAQSYLDTAEVMLLAIDAQGRITLANRYACDILGWTADELIGQDFIEACIPARLKTHTQTLAEGLRSGPTKSVVRNAVATKTGNEKMIEWRNTVLRDENGAVIGTLHSGTDLTEQNESAEALRVAEERMRFALESANIGIWDMDYTTGKLEWSTICEVHYGILPGEFDGSFETYVSAIHPDDRAMVLETVNHAVETGEDFVTHHRSLWRDGTIRFLIGSGRVFRDEHGAPLRAIGIAVDDTDRRSLEEQFQQSQKMEAVGRLAGGVAHDFNNLLTVITGFCELLKADCDPSDPKQHDIAEIHKAGTSAAALTRQLLEFSRKQIIEPTMLDLNEVVTHLRVMLGRVIGEDVNVMLGLRHNLGIIKADRAQIEQVIVNLSVNARDAMPDGGTLTIETADVVIDEQYARAHAATKAGNYVRLTVSDTGTGMTPEVQAHVFEPFFTTKETGKGTGLGLATVHGVVARNGGSISVHSEVGKGTSFQVCFPRAGDFVPQVTAEPGYEPLTGVHKILLVEDAGSLREVAIRMLERLGYEVIAAGNTRQALELFKTNNSIDILLTDVVMPGGSGPDLARKLLELRPDLTVIYMSGYTDDAIAQHGVLNPGVALLNKPFTAKTLDRKIRDSLAAVVKKNRAAT